MCCAAVGDGSVWGWAEGVLLMGIRQSGDASIESGSSAIYLPRKRDNIGVFAKPSLLHWKWIFAIKTERNLISDASPWRNTYVDWLTENPSAFLSL